MTDRVIVYTGSIPQSADMLRTNRNAMVGMGLMALDVFGSGNMATGLACTPTSPASLNVQIAPGRFYSLQNVDNNAYSGLAADTTHQILKQGILADAATLACAAPGTFGFSVNYLIQAAYQDQDTDSTVLPYYNSSNPSVPYSGSGNNGVAQATTRKGIVALSAKPGTPAASGTQTTPAPDSGFVGLYVVTVANGQASIGTGNISVYPGAPFTSGQWNATLTGCTTAPTTLIKWLKFGPVVTAIISPVTATSNAITCTLTGVPSNLLPSSPQVIGAASLTNAGVNTAVGGLEIDNSGAITLIMNATANGFTASGLKGIPNPLCVSWVLGL